MNNTRLYSAHELAKVLKTTTTILVKKLTDAGIDPSHASQATDNRVFRFYDKNALQLVTTWRKQLDAVHAASEAKKNAKRQRAMARRIKEANKIALAAPAAPVLKPLELRLTQAVDDLSAKIELLIGSVDMLSKRVDALQIRNSPPSVQFPQPHIPPYSPKPWEITCGTALQQFASAGDGTGFSLAEMQNEIAAFIDEPGLAPR